jgi:hypothetical protein
MIEGVRIWRLTSDWDTGDFPLLLAVNRRLRALPRRETLSFRVSTRRSRNLITHRYSSELTLGVEGSAGTEVLSSRAPVPSIELPLYPYCSGTRLARVAYPSEPTCSCGLKPTLWLILRGRSVSLSLIIWAPKVAGRHRRVVSAFPEIQELSNTLGYPLSGTHFAGCRLTSRRKSILRFPSLLRQRSVAEPHKLRKLSPLTIA